MIKLIVGLGNPGKEYTYTRHNIGFWFVDALAEQARVDFRKNARCLSLVAQFDSGYLSKPTTFMNDSGRAVSAIAHFYKITPPEILIAHDELDLPVGTIRLKFSGGHGGHNGLRSIIQHLSSNDFYRLRIGIGHPGHKDRVTPYVLSNPSATDQQQILDALNKSIALAPDLMHGSIEKVMQLLHS